MSTEEKVTIKDKEYNLSDLSNEVKELLSLYTEAQQMMHNAKRQAVIHELAAANIANLIGSRVESND